MIFSAIALALLSSAMAFYRNVLIPICLGASFAFLLDPFVCSVQKLKLSRFWASALVSILSVALLVLSGIVLIPFLVDQLSDIIQELPRIAQNINIQVTLWINDLLQSFGINERLKIDNTLKRMDVLREIFEQVKMRSKEVWATGSNMINKAMGLVLTPLVTFFFLSDKERAKAFLNDMIPPDISDIIRVAFDAAHRTLKAVIRGHVKAALIDAVLYSIGFSIIGLTKSIAIGIAAGLCRIIPYADAAVGLALGLTYTALHQGKMPMYLAVVLVVGAVQLVDGMVVTPRFIGGKVGLHPAFVILTVLAAGHWFGFWGVLLAIPVTAVLKTWLKLVFPLYHRSKFYRV